ncbi:MAG: hypothetical protein U0169_04845 [Polyangiaceae bacterium]
MTSASGAQDAPRVVVPAGDRRLLVAWRDRRTAGRSSVFASVVSPDGTVHDGNGFAIADDGVDVGSPCLAPFASGAVAVAYLAFDDRADVQALRVRARALTSDTPDGAPCTAASECASRFCVDGVCCASACTGTCLTCAVTPGTCTPVRNADDADSCPGARSCDATGQCRARPAELCASDADCVTGHCADGVCCDRACTGGARSAT